MSQVANCPYANGALRHPGGAALTRRALQLAALPRGSRLLDLGCGDGETLHLLRASGMQATGLDCGCLVASPLAILRADAARPLPFADAAFDGVLAECSLSLLEDPAAVLGECARILRPGGRLMVSDLYARQPEAIDAVRSSDSCVAGMFVRDELLRWIADAGFAEFTFEDHSRELAQTVAQYIFDHDSLASLWSLGEELKGKAVATAMKQARAGYFLCVAALPDDSTQAGETHE